MKIHLCCGKQHLSGWINVDSRDFGQEVIADIDKLWDFAEEGMVSEIYCKDGFEHVESAEHFLSEAARVLRTGGRLVIWVPHYKNPSAYRLTHKRLMSWSQFNVFPEPHDLVQTLRVVSNKIYIGHKGSRGWHFIHKFINRHPKYWERLGYVSNIEVTFEKREEQVHLVECDLYHNSRSVKY
jgi:predicted SAM-dependent methyltransferase